MGLFNLSNQQVARLVSKTVYKNIYQDILHKDGFGITDKFVTPEQTNAAIVDIYVPIPIQSRFRMRGAETNGAWTNTNNLPNQAGQRKHVLSKRFSIDILKRYDTNIAISEDEVEGTASASLNESFETICRDQIEQDIAININGYTFASQIYSFLMDSFSDTPTADEVKKAVEIYAYDATNRTAAVRAFKLSNAKVSKGDSKLYAGYYPADARQAFLFNTTYLVDLTDTCALSASDVATRMLAGGGMNAFTNEKKTVADFEKGYVGWLDGIALYSVLQQVLDATWYYMGLDDTTTLTGKITASTGLSALVLTKATFETKITTSGVYEFVASGEPGSVIWKLGTETITPADYGIAFTGTAVAADKITLTYTKDSDAIALLENLSCLIAPANATLRGLKPTSFKTVDDPDVQGVIIQPKVNMGVRCLSGNSLKAVFSGTGFDSAANALASITLIRRAAKGKFLLPNLSYDLDPLAARDSTLTTTAQGKQTLTDSIEEG